MIQELNTKAGKLLIVEVPEEAHDFKLGNALGNKCIWYEFHPNFNRAIIPIPTEHNYQLLGRFNELDGKVFLPYIQNFKSNYNIPDMYWDYELGDGTIENLKLLNSQFPISKLFKFDSPKDSFKSLAKSQNINLTDNSLLIRIL